MINDDVIYTSEQISALREKLMDIKNSFYIKSTAGEEVSPGAELGIASREETEAALKSLDQFEVVKTTFAYRPRDTFIKEIAGRIKEANGRKIILDIKVDPGIIGGLEISFAGKYLDLTLRKKLNEI